MLIDGEWVDRDDHIVVRDPEDGSEVGRVPVATEADVEQAVVAANRVRAEPLAAHRRIEVLRRAAGILHERRRDLAETIAREGIKTITEATKEVSRAIETLTISSEEARRVTGETISFDQVPAGEGRLGFTIREPIGVVAAITPFNDPLNLVAHKAGPALAAGNAVIVKPDSKTPLSALLLAEAITEAGLESGWLQVLTGHGRVIGQGLAAHPQVDMVSFTGGLVAGKAIMQAVGIKRVTMELGANCPVIIHRDADLPLALERTTSGAFWAAGQNCLHVQRVYVHRELADDFTEGFIKSASEIRVGPKLDPQTEMGPLIDEQAAERVELIVREAVGSGAEILTGGERQGSFFQPTVLSNVAGDARAVTEEIYGPVTVVDSYETLDEAITKANTGIHGLQGAVFTRDTATAFRVATRLRVGGVMINDSTDFRIDAMPFGGTKLSGIGREGVRSAIEEMTEPKVVCFADAQGLIG